MHDRNIIHRDLKPANILLTTSNTVKICDLGWSAYCEKPRNSICGTLDYMSPEILQNSEYTFSSDIWSLGIILYEILHGRTPFSNMEKSAKLRNIIKREINVNPKLPLSVKNLIKKILSFDPQSRPSINGILKNGWFKDNCNSSLTAGKLVKHKSYGQGVVHSIQGIVCNIRFSNSTEEFIIPEVLKDISYVDESFESESICEALDSFLRPYPIDIKSAKTPQVKDHISFSSINIESSTLSIEPFSADVSCISMTESQMIDKKTELKNLQTKLEKKPSLGKGFKQKRSNSLLDLFFSS